MILHLATDDKFLNHFFIPNLKRFIGLEGHHFLVCVQGDKPLFPVQDTDASVAYIKASEIGATLLKFTSVKKVIIHCFTDEMRKAVSNIKEGIEVVTIVYGYEYYKHIESKDAYQEKTKSFLPRSFYTSIKPSLTKPIAWLKSKRWEYLLKKSFSRIDKVAHYLPQEYTYFKNKLPLEASLLDFNLGVLDQILDLDKLGIAYSSGLNILMGNSANPTNNHIECIYSIAKDSLSSQQKIYCPLSYSVQSESYVDYVIQLGKDKFGEQFIPLLDFMPAEEYNAILASCGTIVMNQHRSQGGASVWSALYRGSALFLTKENPLYSFFIEKGAIIFALKEEGNDIGRQLSEEEKKRNRSVLLDSFSEERVRERYINLVR